jgi:hypothetical protein
MVPQLGDLGHIVRTMKKLDMKYPPPQPGLDKVKIQ